MQKEQFIYINECGDKYYYSDREMTIYHREDGPAIEGFDGGKWWFLNGKRHREDGPAYESVRGYKEWFLNDEALTEEQFNARMNKVELTLDEIVKKFGVSVDNLKIKK